MQIIALVCLFVAGAAANYGEPTVVRIESAAPYTTVRELPSYSGYATAVRSTLPIIPITRYDQQIRGGLSDSTVFETGNGIHSSETTNVVAGRGSMYEGENGQMIKSDSSLVKSGEYSYTAADGTPITLSWVADENGYRATGSHLPTPPPVPAEIQESLRLLPSTYSSYSAPAVLVRSAGY